MFTVKFINYNPSQYHSPDAKTTDVDIDSIYLREREAVSVWLPSSSVYREYIDEEVERHQQNEDLDESEKEILISETEGYKAIITSKNADDDEAYFVAPWEEVYITDSSGKTVHIIK